MSIESHPGIFQPLVFWFTFNRSSLPVRVCAYERSNEREYNKQVAQVTNEVVHQDGSKYSVRYGMMEWFLIKHSMVKYLR